MKPDPPTVVALVSLGCVFVMAVASAITATTGGQTTGLEAIALGGLGLLCLLAMALTTGWISRRIDRGDWP